MRMMKDERGTVVLLTAICLTLLLSFLAFAIDIGNLYYRQRQLQTLADAAAMAGALEASTCGTGSPNCTLVQKAATTALTEGGGVPTPTVFLQCAPASGTGLLLTINNGPCALGTSDPNNANVNYVEAVVSAHVSAFFGEFIGLSSFQISARAEAGRAIPGGYSMFVNGLTLNSGANISDAAGTTGGIYDSGASMEDSGVTVSVGSYNVQGTVTNNCNCTTINPAPTKGATQTDPISTQISNGTLSAPGVPTTAGTNSPGTGGATNYTAGNYPNGVTFSGVCNLAAGVYYMGSNVILNSGASISGSGVTIYLASGAGLNSNGNASYIDLSAPSSGPQAGVLFWGTSGSNIDLDTGSTSSLSGAIYDPAGTLTLNSSSTATAYGVIVANSVIVDTGSLISLSGGTGGAGGGALTISLAE